MHSHFKEMVSAGVYGRWKRTSGSSSSGQRVAKHKVMYLAAAGKYLRLTRRPLEGQKGMDERTVMASQRPSDPE
jgi:hypothetical protein